MRKQQKRKRGRHSFLFSCRKLTIQASSLYLTAVGLAVPKNG